MMFVAAVCVMLLKLPYFFLRSGSHFQKIFRQTARENIVIVCFIFELLKLILLLLLNILTPNVKVSVIINVCCRAMPHRSN